MAEAGQITDSHGRYNLEEDKKTLLEGINQVLNNSIEKEKEINDFLHGVPATQLMLLIVSKKAWLHNVIIL